VLLSIDRVLQLLAEKKSIEKISELANCSIDDVVSVIVDARNLLLKHEKPVSKKKIIIKKNGPGPNDSVENQSDIYSLLNGAELSAVPIKSKLTIYIGGISSGNPGPAGIGVVIYDKEDRQVGKVSSFIGIGTDLFAQYRALLRAIDVGIYFQASNLKIRTDSDLIVKQLHSFLTLKKDCEYQTPWEKDNCLFLQMIQSPWTTGLFQLQN